MPEKSARYRSAAIVLDARQVCALFCAAGILGLVACGSDRESAEKIGVSGAPLDAYCTAKVNGVGTLDVETDYLPHVVHCENGGAPLESLKAQAVAARTYLYYKLDSSGSVDDGQGDQVYSCSSGPTADDIEAVAETSGIVLQYHDANIAAFFVAGGAASPPACKGTGSDPTNTEQYVTYNQGLSGSNIHQSTIGYVDPTNYANRGCMSQLGSRCLADQGDGYDTILKFYYGDDIQFVQSSGACITSTSPDGGSVAGTDGSTGGTPPTRGDGAADTSSNDGSSMNDSSGCSMTPARSEANFTAFFAIFGLLLVRKITKRRDAA